MVNKQGAVSRPRAPECVKMTSSMETKMGAVAVVLVTLVLLVTGVSVAHAYNSSMNGTGSVPVSYLTVNVFDGEEQTSELTFTLSDPAGDPATATGTVTGTPCIRVYSNNVEDAYVYGYFTCSSAKGIAVSHLELSLNGTNVTLFRDAYRETLFDDGTPTHLGSSSQQFAHYADLTITTITVHYYPGIIPSTGDILWTHDAGVTHEAGSVSPGDAVSISDFEFHFVTSREPLIVSGGDPSDP